MKCWAPHVWQFCPQAAAASASVCLKCADSEMTMLFPDLCLDVTKAQFGYPQVLVLPLGTFGVVDRPPGVGVGRLCESGVRPPSGRTSGPVRCRQSLSGLQATFLSLSFGLSFPLTAQRLLLSFRGSQVPRLPPTRLLLHAPSVCDPGTVRHQT